MGTEHLNGDGDILSAIAAGDTRAALATLVQRHGAAVGRLCFALLGSQSDADDATQETYLEAHAALTSFRGDGSAKAFLFTIARRRCARRLERRGGAPPTSDAAVPHRDPAELAELAQDGVRARALLEQIRPSEREALLLRYLGELSFREVADATGIDEAAARKRVSRALLHLRELMRK